MNLKSLFLLGTLVACGQPPKTKDIKNPPASKQIVVGAEQLDKYIPLAKGKQVGLLVNHTSRVGSRHLVDTLLSLGIDIPKVFAPEHGFRGNADAGEHVLDERTDHFEVISLFGSKREPGDEDVAGLEVIIFDIQDVGVRFYTYISSMHYLMEAAARNDIPFIILDRPNPNGSYVDGPFLREDQRSFVGLHPIPIVHGLTVGELAQMIVGEGWLRTEKELDLKVIPVENWEHSMPYSLPIKPSPNLPNDLSIALYPSTCLFEGTVASVGRGTPAPFQHIGHPDYPDTAYSFVPVPSEGAKEPKLDGQRCYGMDFRSQVPAYKFDIAPLVSFYERMGRPEEFFTPYFKLLAGDLDDQIKSGMDEVEIRDSWKTTLEAYKMMRNEYLIYAD